MKITRQADYAVRAVLYLAEQAPGVQVVTSTIAAQQHIPASFLTKIIAQLAAAGVVHTKRGAHGGLTLSKPAHEITLLAVVEAIHGPISLNECVANLATCPLGDHCAILSVWCQAQADLVNRLASTTFAAMARAGQPGVAVSGED